MVLLPNGESFLPSSGLLNMAFFEATYDRIIDETFLDFARKVTFHLNPTLQSDTNTQSQPQSAQFNPFFARTPVPQTSTRNTGAKVIPRDIEYLAHIRIGPYEGNDLTGMGNLLSNQAVITVSIAALPYIRDILSVSIEGRRYDVDESRPIGFSNRRYLMVKLTEINERENPSPDVSIG